MTTTRPVCRRRHITVLDPIRELFADGATPARIRQNLDQARTDLADLQAEIEWLDDLLQRRTAEIAAGTWTAPPEGSLRRPESDPSGTL